MEYEISENQVEKRHRELQKRWHEKTHLAVSNNVIVSRGTQREKGLDVFQLTKYFPRDHSVQLEQDNASQHLTKVMDWNEIYQLNCPVKTVGEWEQWFRQTAEQFSPIGLLVNRNSLVDINEFQKMVHDNPNPKWNQVVGKFRENLELIDHKPTIREIFDQPLHPGEIDRSGEDNIGRRTIIAGENPLLVFQGRTYSQSEETARESRKDDTWRMYLQVETDDMVKMVTILDELGQRYASEGKTLDFKFLAATWNDVGSQIKMGNYKGLSDEMPRIALYFPNPEQRNEFFLTLMETHRQEMLEMSQKRAGKARRPGASVKYDNVSGMEMRHINILDVPGVSEDFVKQNPNWRSKVRGQVTYKPREVI